MVAEATAPRRENVPRHILYYRIGNFVSYTIINAPRGSHCSGMEECRLRDPPQAENPALQDSFLYIHRKNILRHILEKKKRL